MKKKILINKTFFILSLEVSEIVSITKKLNLCFLISQCIQCYMAFKFLNDLCNLRDAHISFSFVKLRKLLRYLNYYTIINNINTKLEILNIKS